jgi:hypothetical protein
MRTVANDNPLYSDDPQLRAEARVDMQARHQACLEMLVAARAQRINECVRDFKFMDAKSFKAKWVMEHDEIFDAAIADGRI